MQTALLGNARLDNIFRTNIQSAYIAGIARQQEAPASLRRRPYFQYDAINDSRTRPAHAAMDNFIAPAGDPVWQRWTPPCGYRCRCIRVALTEKEAVARGWDGVRKEPTVEPDAGWDYHPLAGDGMAGLRQAVDDRSAKSGGIWDKPEIQVALATIRGMTFKQPWLKATNSNDPVVDAFKNAVRSAPDISTPARAAAVTFEKETRADALENGVFIRPDGTVLDRARGLPNKVEFKRSTFFASLGRTFTHNHPNNASFSVTDLDRAFTWGFSELRVVGTVFRHIATPRNGVWPNSDALKQSLAGIKEVARFKAKNLYIIGQLDVKLLDLETHHQFMLELSRQLGFNYSREVS